MNKNKILTIPNILSFLRIAIIPFILISYLKGEIYISTALIIISALTDVVDGFIARRFNMITPLGKAVDPVADKLTLLAIILALCLTNSNVFIVLFLFIIKEFILGVEGLIIIKKTGTTYSSKWHGKVTTAFMYITMIIHIIWVKIPKIISIIMLSICDFFMISTLILYSIRNYKELKQFKA